MTPSQELHELIRSLDKGEKRYFRLCSSLQGGTKAYLQLFNAIDRQRVYDEAAIRKAFARAPFIRQLASHKIHLRSRIISSLTAYHSGNLPGLAHREALNEIEVLYHKGLHTHAFKRAERLQRVSEHSDQPLVQLELLSLKRKIMRMNNYVLNTEEELDSITAQEEQALRDAGKMGAYIALENKLSFLVNNVGKAKNRNMKSAYEAIAKHPRLERVPPGTDPYSRALHFFILASYHFTLLEFDKSYALYKKAHRALIERPVIVREHTDLYIYILTYLVANASALGRKRDHALYLQEMRTIRERLGIRLSHLQQVRVFSNSYINELLLHLNYPETTVKPGTIETIEQGLKRWGPLINSRLRISFYINLALLYFGKGDHKRSLHWIGFLLNQEEKNTSPDQANMARILHLAIHYELGNYDFLLYRIKNDILYFQKRRSVFPAEVILLKLIRDMARAYDATQKNGLIEKARKAIVDILFSGNHRMIGFDYVSWMDSKLKRVSYGEALAKNLKMYRKKI